jgi:hypothetical protein
LGQQQRKRRLPAVVQGGHEIGPRRAAAGGIRLQASGFEPGPGLHQPGNEGQKANYQGGV